MLLINLILSAQLQDIFSSKYLVSGLVSSVQKRG